MLVTLVVCVLGVVTLAAVGAQRFDVEDAAAVRALFERFEREHDRRYADPRERRAKLAIFKDNLATINELNDKFNPHTNYGITKYTDLTPEEFVNKHTGWINSLGESESDCDNVTSVPDIHAPDSFDWREHGAVTEVKNQGHCGSCWAFGTIGNIEGQYAIKHKKLVAFSEQQLVSCDDTDYGCHGGLIIRAVLKLIKMGGIESEEDYSYVSGKGSVPNCTYNQNKVKAKITGCKSFLTGNVTEDDLKNHLVSNGPIAIALAAKPLHHYSDGTVIDCSYDHLTHAVLLVGYGTSEYGVPYWLIKNSWGVWGEKGYFRIKRGENCLSIMDGEAASGVVE